MKAVTAGIAAKAAFGADVCELRGLATHETGHLLIPANQTILLKDFGGGACILFDVLLHRNLFDDIDMQFQKIIPLMGEKHDADGRMKFGETAYNID